MLTVHEQLVLAVDTQRQFSDDIRAKNENMAKRKNSQDRQLIRGEGK